MFRPSKRSRFFGGVGAGGGAMNSSSNVNQHQHASSCWLDASPFQQQQQQEQQHHHPFMRTTLLATAVTRDIFLERFQKEIIDRFQFSLYGLSRQPRSSSTNEEESSFADARHCHMLLKRRIVVGFNACTKALQSWCFLDDKQKKGVINNTNNNNDCLSKTPSLVVIALDDSELALKTSPTAAAMLLAHIPLLAHQAGVPLLILPGPNSAQHLNRLLKVHSGHHRQKVVSTSSAARTADPAMMMTMPPRVTVMAVLPRDANEFTSPAGQVIHGAVDSLVDFFLSKAYVGSSAAAATNHSITSTSASCVSATASAGASLGQKQQQQQPIGGMSSEMIC
jgi:hypothetical protein